MDQSSHVSRVELRSFNLFLPLMGHSNAVGPRLYYDAVSQTLRFGMEIARPLRAPFAKDDEPCIMWVRDFVNKTLWIPAGVYPVLDTGRE